MGVGTLRAVFLDRDGVLNRVVRPRTASPIRRPAWTNWKFCRTSPEALAALKQCGFLLLVVTNQPDVARGSAAARRGGKHA